jgi:hypothetical protein
MQGTPDLTAEWPDPAYRRSHFRFHRAQLGIQTEDDYDASARETIRNGVRLLYTDRESGEDRVGYFVPERRRFTALSDDEAIITSHFRASENYVRHLPDVIYPAP